MGLLLLRTDDIPDPWEMEMYGVGPDFKDDLVEASANQNAMLRMGTRFGTCLNKVSKAKILASHTK
jgi:hypothetical protein